MNIDQLINFILKRAQSLRDGAGYNGSYGDGGAGILEDQVKFFNLGRSYERTNVAPYEWIQFKKDLEKETDPEYQEYLRLKKKFD